MAPSVVGVATGTSVTTANPTVTLATTPVAGDILILSTFCGTAADAFPTAVSGCGATWTRIPSGATYFHGAWIGVGATSTGTITATAAASAGSRILRVHHVRGVSADAVFLVKTNGNYKVRATSNQLAIGIGTGQAGAGSSTVTFLPPQYMWTVQTEAAMGARFINSGYVVPHPVADLDFGGLDGGVIVVGCPVAGATITRRNLVGGSSSESKNVLNGTNASMSQSAVTDPAMFGTRSSKMTATAAVPNCSRFYSGDPRTQLVADGSVYTASAYANSVNARNGRAFIRWKTYSGTLISTTNGATTALPANTWTRLSVVGATAPTNAVYGEPGIEITDGVSTDVTFVDGWLMEQSATLGTFFDGYTTDAGRINFHTGMPYVQTTQNADEWSSLQTTVPTPGANDPSIVGINTGANTTAANPTVSLTTTPLPGDVLIVADVRGDTNIAVESSAMAGCGATWTRVGGTQNYFTFWIGTGATSTGTITGTAAASSAGRALRVFHLRGVTKDTYVQQYRVDQQPMATPNQIVIAGAFSQTSGAGAPAITATVPANMWTDDTEFTLTATNRRFNSTHVIPKLPWSFNCQGNAYSLILVVGSPLPKTKVARRNLAVNPNMELGTYNWLGSGVAVSSITKTTSAVGNASLTANQNASATCIMRAGTGGNSPAGPAVEGRTYTVSCWVRCNNARSAGVVPMWLSGGYTVMSTATYTLTPLVANTWTRVSWTGVAPAGTKWVAPESKFDSCVTGDVFWWDGFLIEESGTLGDYFDGWSSPPPGDDLQNFFVGGMEVSGSVQVVPTATKVWSRESGVWVDRSGCVMKAWNGTTWVTKRPKYWNGTAWVAL